MSDMTPPPAVVAAKLLLLEHDPLHYQGLLDLCMGMGLSPLPRSAVDAMATLAQHKDMAGVLLADDLPCESGDALALALAIHRQRPELPIFLRRSGHTPLDGTPVAGFTQAWQGDDLAGLRSALELNLFSLRYPAELVDGVVELTCNALRAMFPHANVSAEPPYVVHDRIIFGQVSTLIALESDWCRGYMMLQCEESALRQGMVQGLGTEGLGGDLSFRQLNHVLAETTNLIWGAFKNRYIPSQTFVAVQSQVPIVINHEQKYISFGSQDPQLCVRYQVSDPRRPGLPPLTIVQRLIFNLHWAPEGFAAAAQAAGTTCLNTGELELF